MKPKEIITENCPYHPELSCPFFPAIRKVMENKDAEVIKLVEEARQLVKNAIDYSLSK